jgi:hypothetical protein
MQAVISNGGSSPDEQLLSREAINRVFVQQPSGINRVLMMPVRVDLSYALAGSTNCIGITSGNRCYWRGWGGPIVVNDLDNRITLTYMRTECKQVLPTTRQARQLPRPSIV